VYKFQTSQGPDGDAEGVEREGNVEGCPHPQLTRGLRECRKLPQRGPGHSPSGK